MISKEVLGCDNVVIIIFFFIPSIMSFTNITTKKSWNYWLRSFSDLTTLQKNLNKWEQTANWFNQVFLLKLLGCLGMNCDSVFTSERVRHW